MVENSRVRVYCFWAVRSNQAFSWSAPSTRSSVPRTITEMGLFSTKRSKTLPSMVTSPRECVEKVSSVTSGEREDHLNRAGVYPHGRRPSEGVGRNLSQGYVPHSEPPDRAGHRAARF